MKGWDIIILAFCSSPGNWMLLLDLSKEVIVIKLSLRKIDLEWGVEWTGQGWRQVKRSEGEEVEHSV